MTSLDLPPLTYAEALNVLGQERHALTRETRLLEQRARHLEQEIGKLLAEDPALRDPALLLVAVGQVAAALDGVRGAWEGLAEGLASLHVRIDGTLVPNAERRERVWDRLRELA